MDVLKNLEVDGQKLKRMRADKPLEAVAEAVGVSKSQICNIESKASKPSADILVRMLWFYGVHDIRQVTSVDT